jgi:hypothetical protein
MRLTTHLHLAPASKNNGARPPLFMVWNLVKHRNYIFMAWCLIKHRIYLHGMVLN